MKYRFKDVPMSIAGQEFSKQSPKELLQYALGPLLYMPALRLQVVDEILHDDKENLPAICLDLEDAVSDQALEIAENSLLQILHQLAKAVDESRIHLDELPLLFIRFRSPDHMATIASQLSPRELALLTGFTLPKFSRQNAQAYIDSFKTIQARSPEPLYILPILESESIIRKEGRSEELAALRTLLSNHQEDILGIRVGATDLSNFYAVRRPIDRTVYEVQVLADCLIEILNVFGRDYVVSGPVWEYFGTDGAVGPWSRGLQAEIEADQLNGFFGKTCIHPSQVPYVAKSGLVTFADYRDALAILEMEDSLVSVAKSYQQNRMNEQKPHTNWAKRILSLAQIYGVRAEEDGDMKIADQARGDDVANSV